jgi:hypothetical protein
VNLSVKLITALVAFVLLVVGLVALTSSGSTARAAVDANVYVANEWSKLTNDPTPLSGYTYAGSGKTIYSTFVEVADTTGVRLNTIQSSSDTLTIFVEDADVNVAVPKSKTTLNTTAGPGQTKTVVLTSMESPIVDVDGDGGILDDIAIIAPDTNTDISGSFTLQSAFAGTALIDASITVVQTAAGGAPGVGGGKFGLSWKTSAVNTVIVKVATTQDATGKTFSINETGPSTGKFKGSITLRDVQNSAPAPTRIAVQSGGIVTVTYSDATPKNLGVAKSVTSTATTETGAPTVTTTAPVTGSATQVRRPAFTGSVTDTTSGLDVSGILVYIDERDEAANGNVVRATLGSTDDDNNPTTPTASVDGVNTSTYAFTPAADLPLGFALSTPDHIVDWQVQASDLAGNVGWSDSTAAADSTQGRGAAATVKIDRTLPGITNAYTGFRLDSTTTPALRKTDSATSIEIDFNDVMDSETIQNTDFEVKVGVVTQVPTEASVGSTGFTDKVFLTLGTALATKDAPTVTIVNSISDAAGNTTSTGSKVAKDALAPTVTVALSGGSSATAPTTLTKLKMTITITSDENLSADPTVAIYTALDAVNAEGTVTAVNQGGNVWIASLSGGSLTSAKKSVYVTATDSAATVSQVGAGAVADGLVVPATVTIGQTVSGKKGTATTGALTFTLDKVAPTLTLSPTGSTSDASPFIRWDFGEKVTVSKAEFGLSAATLADVTTELGTSDTQVYVRATSGLALGLYKATGTATDLAGNKATALSSTFTIAKRVEFKLTVLPGTTLVSFPLTPADTSINSVFSPAGIVSVSSYDSAAGTFASAVRDAESGDLAGDLASVGSGIGYVVVADAVSALVVPIPSLTASSIPPTITVLKGWSLVGVTDVVGDGTGALRQPGSSIMAGTAYFPVKVTQVYSWNPTSKIWQALSTRPVNDGGANVVAGEAYWAYATAADVIVP